MAVSPVGGIGATPFVPPTLQPAGTPGAEKSAFAKSLKDVQGLEDNANKLAGDLATGSLQDVHQYTAAAAKASIGIELTAALRNRAVEAYQEIMRMQV